MKITKQSFHQHHDRLLKRLELEAYLLKIVQQVREDHPTLGCRDLYYYIKPEDIGRDQFEDFCRYNDLYVKKIKNYQRTTDSSGVKRFDNLVENLVISKINQLWVSDITYYRINEEFYYITMIMDAFSRRIIGHTTSTRLLTTQTTLPALKMALKTREGQNISGLIFHSDGGGQYYADEFIKLTKSYEILNSMCIYPWENPYAERINGVIKNNYLKHRIINNYLVLTQEVDRSINLYNYKKPHINLNRLSPIEYENRIFVSGKKIKDEESTKKYAYSPEGISPSGLR